jgi:hypothetical protein
MIYIATLHNKSHHSDIKVSYQELNIERIVDSWFFSLYLEEDKNHLSKSEMLAVHILNCINRVIQLKIDDDFIFYYDFDDRYSEGINIQRDSIKTLTIQKIISEESCLNPYILDVHQRIKYTELNSPISEDRTEFLLGLLRSVESLLGE